MVNLSFAKLVATPSDSSWSQVYNAGNLFACLSLSKESTDEETQLNQIGKALFSHLESEFFTLEDKSLQSIKEAIANTTHTIPSNVTGDLCLVYFKNNILYVFIFGRGNAIMKRGGKVAVLLEENSENREIKSASGYLEQDDVVVLQTHQFAKDMSIDTISSALELNLPSDIAEALSPAMHEKDDGGQAAIIISYKEAHKPIAEPLVEEESIIPDPEIVNFPEESKPQEENMEINAMGQDEPEHAFPDETQSQPQKKMGLPKLKLPAFITSLNIDKIKKLDHRKKIFLSIAVLIAAVLILSISLTHNQQEQSKTTALFKQVYDPALRDYNDGKGIQSINSTLANSDFLKAQKALTDGKDKFKNGSTEEKQITDLLSKVNSELGGTTSTAKITPKAVTLNKNDLLSIVKENSDGVAFAKDKDSIDYLTSSAVVSIGNDGKSKDIIKNDKDWVKGVGLAVYQGNLFVLDQKNGVLKYSAGSAGFGKNSYLKDKPDLSNAASIAIDGSVWILLKDGNILKYTKGASDDFKVKGMDKPAKGATRLFTNLDIENLYVLDPGNSRIIKINKEGSFQSQYVADILKNAEDLEVSEKDGKILVLSGGKLWELPL